MNTFKFFVSTNLRFGVGESEKLGEEILERGFNKVAVVIDRGVVNNSQILKAIASIEKAGIAVDVYKNEAVEPTYDYLGEFKKNFVGKDYQCLVGIGGGSAMDLTKGIAVLLTNEGDALSFRGFPKLKNRPMPVIAIPTTAGTGSEVTYNAVFTNAQEKRKLGINSTLNFPVAAIIDPLIYLDCPLSVSVSAGSDALVHTMESFVHRNHTPISRMYSKEAFRLIFNNLGKIKDDPKNIEVRGALALGAYLAGTALFNAGSGPAGAFSYPLGAVYHVPHGYAGAIFLSSVTRINVEKGYQGYDELYDLIEGADTKKSILEKNQQFAVEMQKLMDKIEIPRSLSHFGLGPKDIEFMVEQYDKLKAGIDQNPISITKEDAQKMIYALA